LILDDCTSALDANTERKIQETLTELLQGRTAIMVSQRISMAMRCHQICVLENGVVSECGTHKELLANHGFYARLYAQQTGQPQDG
ncbi:MAG: ABC transporter ATP-binding protein, partial [Victivallales bacterium]|nr:ABC transporter ATP-binding protein [Victivallales bacterium]